MEEVGATAASVPVSLRSLAPTASCALVVKSAYKGPVISLDPMEYVLAVL